MCNETESCYELECIPFYINFLYFVLLNRIVRGWTTEEVSFLLGLDDDHIGKMERLEIVDASIELTTRLYSLFPNHRFVMRSGEKRREFRYRLQVHQENHVIYYTMYKYVNIVESVVVFKLMEEARAHRDDNAARSVQHDAGMVEGLVKILVESDFFEKYRSALAIYHFLKDQVETYFAPIHLKTQLGCYVGRKGKAALKRTRARSYFYRYIKHKT